MSLGRGFWNGYVKNFKCTFDWFNIFRHPRKCWLIHNKFSYLNVIKYINLRFCIIEKMKPKNNNSNYVPQDHRGLDLVRNFVRHLNFSIILANVPNNYHLQVRKCVHRQQWAPNIPIINIFSCNQKLFNSLNLNNSIENYLLLSSSN